MSDHLTKLWEKVDAVLVVNLDHRTDRWEQFLTNFGHTIPREKLHRISAIYGKNLPGYGKKPWFHGKSRDANWAARGGCTLSHKKAIAFAQQQNWDHVLVFEDDALLNPHISPEEFAQKINALFHNPDWQLAYLGYTSPLQPQRIVEKLPKQAFLAEFCGANSAHAYIVRKRAISWIFNHLPGEENIWAWVAQHRSYDRYKQQNFCRFAPIFGFNDCLFLQSESFSDILQTNAPAHSSNVYQIHLDFKSTPFFALRKFLRIICAQVNGSVDVVRVWKKRFTGLS